MKYKYTRKETVKKCGRSLALLSLISIILAGCGESFLSPEPKSFFAPENTFNKKAGLQGVLNNLNLTIAREYYGSNAEIMSEYLFTDVGLPSESRSSVQPYDQSVDITPTNTSLPNWHVGDYWDRAYNGIGYANIVISNINNVKDWNSTEGRNSYLASAYFHQAYWYYRLVHQFGDVPVYLEQINEPRLGFNSFSREAILKQMRDHMEWAVENLPKNVRRGEINRAAGLHLLTKIYLSLRQFEDAINAASQVINNTKYALVQDRFGSGRYADDPEFNVMWDLFEKENIGAEENTEAILVTQDQFNVSGSPGPTKRNRNLVPAFIFINGMTVNDQVLTDSLGRGQAFSRPSPYYSYGIWNDPDDYRHSETNWFSRSDFYFNDKKWLEENGFENLYGKPLTEDRVKKVGYQGNWDSTRTWFSFPYNKVHVPDKTMEKRIEGGHSDWYIFRLAGTYLLRAEAYYWNNQLALAADDINMVRQRANADPVDPSEVDIGYIFDERARELWREEPRKTEMTRVSYIMAQLGVNGYSLDNMHQNNWWYERTMAKNIYFRNNLQIHGLETNTYRLDASRIYWPVPQDEIDANINGTINQWKGYAGSGNNIDPRNYEDIQQIPGANIHQKLQKLD